MASDTLDDPQPELQFAALIDEVVADSKRQGELTTYLREDHPVYDRRGTATTVRMRGWVLNALSRTRVSEEALLFVLDELDTGNDAYLVAAAARALRAYPHPAAAFAPFVLRALNNIRFRDDPVSFDHYGKYATSAAGTSPLRELLLTLAWLGPHAGALLPQIQLLRTQHGGLPRKLRGELDAALKVIQHSTTTESGGDACCNLPAALNGIVNWAFMSRKNSQSLDSVRFEDHQGESVTYKEYFGKSPTIVIFFYTRCDNPLKCSLSVTKLAQVQKILEDRGLNHQIRTAAITYDSDFDTAERLRGYGRNRGIRMDANHRMLRVLEGFDTLRGHFALGVNFIESLVNRHRVEAYVLDARGQIAALFERIHWDEQKLVDRAIELLAEKDSQDNPMQQKEPILTPAMDSITPATVGLLASIGAAFIPKCPVCWAAYFSVCGIAGLHQIPYTPWLQPALALVMLVNLGSLWLRARATGRVSGFYVSCAGAGLIVASTMFAGWDTLPVWGVALTIAGALISAINGKPRFHLSKCNITVAPTKSLLGRGG